MPMPCLRAGIPARLSLVRWMCVLLLRRMSCCCVIVVLVCCSHVPCVDRAFEPVGERCARSLRSRVRLAMAVTPSMDLSLIFG
jgi:hypothetical protein